MDTPSDTYEIVSVLDGLASRANEEHRQTFEAAASALGHALACGRALMSARDQVADGAWTKWVENNLDFTRSLAGKYLRLATNEHLLTADTSPRTISGALAHLSALDVGPIAEAGCNREPLSDEQVEEAKRLRATGTSYTKIALILGVSKHKVETVVNPDYASNIEAARKRWLKRSAAAKKALKAKETAEAVRRVGGSSASAYALLRRCSLDLDRAIVESEDAETIELLRRAVGYVHKAEDEIVYALRVDRRTDRRPLRTRLAGPGEPKRRATA